MAALAEPGDGGAGRVRQPARERDEFVEGGAGRAGDRVDDGAELAAGARRRKRKVHDWGGWLRPRVRPTDDHLLGSAVRCSVDANRSKTCGIDDQTDPRVSVMLFGPLPGAGGVLGGGLDDQAALQGRLQ